VVVVPAPGFELSSARTQAAGIRWQQPATKE
jgi:hypothetical protein